MRGRGGGSDWPLVLFTVLAQASAGTALASGAIRWISGALPPRSIAVTGLALLGAGALAALAHLRNPRAARHALANLGSSWLSRELALGVLFGASTALAVVWPALDILAAATGALLVLAIARVYMLRTVPAWNTRATPVAFFATALLLGAAAVALVVALARAPPFDEPGAADSILRRLGLVAAVTVVLELGVERLHLRRLAHRGGAAAESAAIVRDDHRVLFRGRLVLALAGAALLLAAVWPAGGSARPVPVVAACALLLVSELLGRALFYASHRRVGL